MNLSILVNAPPVVLKYYKSYEGFLWEIPSGWEISETEMEMEIEPEFNLDNIINYESDYDDYDSLKYVE